MASQKVSEPITSGMLFIPDISGFTQFVRNTDIVHSQHIIQELLETIIEANEIDMEISEIEGDAILFYKMGKAPTAAELLAQIQRMYVQFHFHLKKYEKMRICQCGACLNAHALRLKFILHYGPIAFSQVKDHVKLFGEDVIVAHRLLKNDIEQDEYALFSSSLISACESWVNIPVVSWADIVKGNAEYDSGPVEFCHIPLQPLQDRVPEPAIEEMGFKGQKVKVAEMENTINAPIEFIFSVIMDLKNRPKWNAFVQSIEKVSDQILRNGSSHLCIMNEKNQPVQTMHDLTLRENTIAFWETDDKKEITNNFVLIKMAPALTKMEAVFFIKKSMIMQIVFNLFIKRKFLKLLEETRSNLKAYCQNMYKEGKTVEGGVYIKPLPSEAS
jgi:uncharacterized membrane protein